jgi:DNA polymerase III delta subunit
MTYNEAFEKLLKDGTIHQFPKDAIFDFVDAILDRKVNQVYDLFRQCQAVGEGTLVMLSVLYNNAKAVLQVQSCDNKDVTGTTGLTGWQIKCAKSHLNKYEIWELVDMLRLIQKLESGIKQGIYDDEYVMDYLLCNIL